MSTMQTEQENEAADLITGFRQEVRRRFRMWAIRWTITGVILAVVVALNPELMWLVVAAGVMALISLVLIYTVSAVMERRYRLVQEKLDRLHDGHPERLQDNDSGESDEQP